MYTMYVAECLENLGMQEPYLRNQKLGTYVMHMKDTFDVYSSLWLKRYPCKFEEETVSSPEE